MRLAPAVLATLDDPGAPDRVACHQSSTTHSAPQAVDACALLAAMLLEAILRLADPLPPRCFGEHEIITAGALSSARRSARAAMS